GVGRPDGEVGSGRSVQSREVRPEPLVKAVVRALIKKMKVGVPEPSHVVSYRLPLYPGRRRCAWILVHKIGPQPIGCIRRLALEHSSAPSFLRAQIAVRGGTHGLVFQFTLLQIRCFPGEAGFSGSIRPAEPMVRTAARSSRAASRTFMT